jgi:biopolymer transport protein ExbD
MNRKRRRRRHNRAVLVAKLNITSLADVTLVLLVIFLITATVATELVKLNLPGAGNTRARDISLARVVAVDKGGRYHLEGAEKPIKRENLWTALVEIKGNAEWELALVRADKDAPSHAVAVAIQCLQGLGVGELAFVVDRPEAEDN